MTRRAGIPAGEYCPGCGGVSTGVHLDRALLPKKCACGEPDDAVYVHGEDLCWRPCRGECGGWVNPTNGLCHQTHPLTGDRVKARAEREPQPV